MKHSEQFFVHYVGIWARLLQQANHSKDAAQYLLTHDARTPLFYLEAMTRVLMHEHNPKRMRKLNELFKVFEDALGVMDYYAGLLHDFKGNRKIPVKARRLLQDKYRLSSEHLNTLLHEYRWLGTDADRLRKVHKSLDNMDWLNDRELRKALKRRYQDDIQAISREMKRPLEDIENDVHELRRDTRWLSIFPQAFKGFIRLHPQAVIPTNLSKYATTEIIQSPFNQLPAVDSVDEVLWLNPAAYYGISWLIAQLGTLKDEGLRLQALTELLRETSLVKLSRVQALKDAQTRLGEQQPAIDEILQTARVLVKQVRDDKVMAQLLEV